MKYFVSGASGGIGQSLCCALQLRKSEVIAGLRRDISGPWNSVANMDLLSNPVLPCELKDVSCVFHLAGKAHALSEDRQDEREYFKANVEGTRKLLEASKRAGVRRFVFFSSVKAICEASHDPVDELSACNPQTPYGASKLEAERLVLDGGYVPEPVVLRLSMVYGPFRKGNLPRMIQTVSKGYFPALPELNNARSMVHVTDVVKAALLVSSHPAAVGQVFIVTDGKYYSTRQLYEIICNALNKPVPRWTIPIKMLRVIAKIGDGVGRLRGRRFIFDSDALEKLSGSAVYSSKKLQNEIGYSSEIDLQAALPEIVEYLGIS